MATPKSTRKPTKSAGAGKKGNISKRLGLIFPVGRLGSMLRRGRYAKQIAAGAPVYLAAVMEYLTAEMLELAGKVASQHKKKRITPRALTLAIRHDEELNQLLRDATISQGGVVPNMHDILKKKKGGKGKKKSSASQAI